MLDASMLILGPLKKSQIASVWWLANRGIIRGGKSRPKDVSSIDITRICCELERHILEELKRRGYSQESSSFLDDQQISIEDSQLDPPARSVRQSTLISRASQLRFYSQLVFGLTIVLVEQWRLIKNDAARLSGELHTVISHESLQLQKKERRRRISKRKSGERDFEAAFTEEDDNELAHDADVTLQVEPWQITLNDEDSGDLRTLIRRHEDEERLRRRSRRAEKRAQGEAVQDISDNEEVFGDEQFYRPDSTMFEEHLSISAMELARNSSVAPHSPLRAISPTLAQDAPFDFLVDNPPVEASPEAIPNGDTELRNGVVSVVGALHSQHQSSISTTQAMFHEFDSSDYERFMKEKTMKKSRKKHLCVDTVTQLKAHDPQVDDSAKVYTKTVPNFSRGSYRLQIPAKELFNPSNIYADLYPTPPTYPAVEHLGVRAVFHWRFDTVTDRRRPPSRVAVTGNAKDDSARNDVAFEIDGMEALIASPTHSPSSSALDGRPVPKRRRLGKQSTEAGVPLAEEMHLDEGPVEEFFLDSRRQSQCPDQSAEEVERELDGHAPLDDDGRAEISHMSSPFVNDFLIGDQEMVLPEDAFNDRVHPDRPTSTVMHSSLVDANSHRFEMSLGDQMRSIEHMWTTSASDSVVFSALYPTSTTSCTHAAKAFNNLLFLARSGHVQLRQSTAYEDFVVSRGFNANQAIPSSVEAEAVGRSKGSFNDYFESKRRR